jgi:excisionase family DNA binding protein
MNEFGKFLTIKEFAEKLRVHPNTIRKAIKNGKINAFQTGTGKKSSYRISETELGRIVEFDMTKIIERIVEEKMEKRNGEFTKN